MTAQSLRPDASPRRSAYHPEPTVGAGTKRQISSTSARHRDLEKSETTPVAFPPPSTGPPPAAARDPTSGASKKIAKPDLERLRGRASRDDLSALRLAAPSALAAGPPYSAASLDASPVCCKRIAIRTRSHLTCCPRSPRSSISFARLRASCAALLPCCAIKSPAIDHNLNLASSLSRGEGRGITRWIELRGGLSKITASQGT